MAPPEIDWLMNELESCAATVLTRAASSAFDGDAAAPPRDGLALIEAVERAAAGIADQHDMLHAAPLELGHRGGDVEHDLLMHGRGVVVGIARRGGEHGDAGLDQARDDVMVLEIAPRMHHHGAGAGPGVLARGPQQAAMLAPVGRLEQQALDGTVGRKPAHVERRAGPVSFGNQIHGVSPSGRKSATTEMRGSSVRDGTTSWKICDGNSVSQPASGLIWRTPQHGA